MPMKKEKSKKTKRKLPERNQRAMTNREKRNG